MNLLAWFLVQLNHLLYYLFVSSLLVYVSFFPLHYHKIEKHYFISHENVFIEWSSASKIPIILFVVVTMSLCFEYNETKYFHSENKRTKVKNHI